MNMLKKPPSQDIPTSVRLFFDFPPTSQFSYIFLASPQLLDEPSSPRQRARSAPDALRIQTDVPIPLARAPSPSPSLGKLPSFSLIGALEFRDVVSSLKNEAAASSLGIFDSPVAPYAGGHYHRPVSKSPRSSRQAMHSSLDENSNNDLRLGPRHTSSVDSDATVHDQPTSGPSDYFSERHELPYIMRTPASPSVSTSEAGSEEQLYTPSKRQRIWSIFRQTFHTLFPTLSNLRQQSLLAQVACVFAAPAILGLTLTLPVVVTPYGSDPASPEKMLTGGDARLVDFEEEGEERVLIAEEETQENMHQLQFNRWLMAAQCVLGPLFCVAVLFGIFSFHSIDILLAKYLVDGTKYERYYLLGTGLGGFALGVLVLIFSNRGDNVSARMARCSMGFIVAIVWIMAIADEVVSVLQTFGIIFGLSDAIIGLTIFAMGNSLADLVANMSVAVSCISLSYFYIFLLFKQTFAPMMGFSACFGGPMLNILLGVGISGSYVISQTAKPYEINVSTTLYVSSFGLLFLLAATLVFVPLNNYYLTRRWGILLIATYTVIMIVNIVVELM